MSESFNVEVGVRQGCVMSPWLFSIYMDGYTVEALYNVSLFSEPKMLITEKLDLANFSVKFSTFR